MKISTTWNRVVKGSTANGRRMTYQRESIFSGLLESMKRETEQSHWTMNGLLVRFGYFLCSSTNRFVESFIYDLSDFPSPSFWIYYLGPTSIQMTLGGVVCTSANFPSMSPWYTASFFVLLIFLPILPSFLHRHKRPHDLFRRACPEKEWQYCPVLMEKQRMGFVLLRLWQSEKLFPLWEGIWSRNTIGYLETKWPTQDFRQRDRQPGKWGWSYLCYVDCW